MSRGSFSAKACCCSVFAFWTTPWTAVMTLEEVDGVDEVAGDVVVAGDADPAGDTVDVGDADALGSVTVDAAPCGASSAAEPAITTIDRAAAAKSSVLGRARFGCGPAPFDVSFILLLFISFTSLSFSACAREASFVSSGV
jgi:hypothetical protein